MIWALTAVLCVLVVECAWRMPFAPALAGLHRTALRAMRLARLQGVSDRRKEKAMRIYAGAMMAGTMRLAGLLGLLFGAGGALALVFDRIVPNFSAFLSSGRGVMITLVIASGYLVLRKGLAHVRLRRSRQASS